MKIKNICITILLLTSMIKLNSMQLYKDIFDLINKHPDDPSIYTAMIPFKSQVNAHRYPLTSYLDILGAPLGVAIMFRKKNAVIALLKHGAHAHEFDILHHAAIYGNHGVVKILADYGANLTVKMYGDTLLHHAVCPGSGNHNTSKTVQVLLDHHADVNAKNDLGNTPLHLTVSDEWTPFIEPKDRIATVKILLKNGANPNIQCDSADGTSLHWAAFSAKPQPKIVKMLLKHGADVDAMCVTNVEGKFVKPIVFFETEYQRPRTREVSECITLLEQAERWRENKLRTTWVTAAVVTGRKLHLPINPTPLNTCTAIIPYTGRSEIIE